MDETDSRPTETSASDAAKGVAEDIRADAEKTLAQIKGNGWRDFFSFDKLIFPSIARIVFVVFTVCMALVGILGIFAGLASISEVGFLSGLWNVCLAVISAAFMIIMARLWIEIVLVVFKINDGVQGIRKSLAAKTDTK